MKRRELLAASAAALCLPLPAALAAGLDPVPYSRAVYEQALASGEPFMLDFYASW